MLSPKLCSKSVELDVKIMIIIIMLILYSDNLVVKQAHTALQ